MMKLTKEEQETIILFDRSSNMAEIYTFEPRLKRTMKNLSKDFPELICKTAGDNGSVLYSFPKELVTIRRPRPKKKLSEMEKEKLAKRLQNKR